MNFYDTESEFPVVILCARIGPLQLGVVVACCIRIFLSRFKKKSGSQTFDYVDMKSHLMPSVVPTTCNRCQHHVVEPQALALATGHDTSLRPSLGTQSSKIADYKICILSTIHIQL